VVKGFSFLYEIPIRFNFVPFVHPSCFFVVSFFFACSSPTFSLSLCG
jgi:hypothetical protein